MGKYKLLWLVSGLIYMLLPINVRSDISRGEWQLVKDKDGIQVYTMDMEFTHIVKARAVTRIDSSLKKIKAILDDVEHRHEWVPFLEKSEVLQKQSREKRLEYSLFSAPWPASDRDFVYSLEQISSSEKQIKYKMKSQTTELRPEQEWVIRGEIFESIYSLTAITDASTRVELIYHADPKGWLPDWIINIIQRAFPYKILHNLKGRVKQNENNKSHSGG